MWAQDRRRWRLSHPLANPGDGGAPLRAGLAAYWKLDEEDAVGDAMRVDQLGSSNVVPTSTAVLSAPGVLGNGASFAGGAWTMYGLTGGNGDISMAGDFAVSLWAYVNIFGDWQIAFHLYDSVNAVECFRVQMEGPWDESGAAAFVLMDGVGGGFTNAWLLPDQWHHLVVSVSGNTMSFYDNGALADTVMLSGTRATPNEVRLGCNQAGFAWAGLLDEIGFWNRALSATEVTQLYNAGNGLAFEEL